MEDNKKCYKCQQNKPFSEFNKCIKGTFGLHGHCRQCQKDTRRDWYLKHRQEQIKDAKEWSQSEVGKLSRRIKWETQKHILGPKQNERRRKEEAKIKARIQRKKWMQIPQNRIAQNLRKRIQNALKNVPKIISTEQITGCSFGQLKTYLESLFLPNMSWDNYGQWHVDHIKPCASFDLTLPDEQIRCFHYSNLQPLWAKDNLSKGSKVISR